MSAVLKAPFVYFGGKSSIAPAVWNRLGQCVNYVEPFFGSGAMLLARHQPFDGTETVNDADGMVANFWRSVKSNPEAVAEAADWPVNENDLHARHAWLVGQKESIVSRMEGDPEWCDPKAAGWWAWGMSCWIGSGFCSGNGPWSVQEIDGARQLVHLGDAGQGVNRKLVHLGSTGQGEGGVYAWMDALSDRLRSVRVCCGDWRRICGPTPTTKLGLTGVFLDPPYSDAANRVKDLYSKDCMNVAHDVREWCAAHGSDPLLRIALCGYAVEHEALEAQGWSVLEWKAKGGYGSQGDGEEEGSGRANSKKERVWFSPHCIKESALFAMMP